MTMLLDKDLGKGFDTCERRPCRAERLFLALVQAGAVLQPAQAIHLVQLSQLPRQRREKSQIVPRKMQKMRTTDNTDNTDNTDKKTESISVPPRRFIRSLSL